MLGLSFEEIKGMVKGAIQKQMEVRPWPVAALDAHFFLPWLRSRSQRWVLVPKVALH